MFGAYSKTASLMRSIASASVVLILAAGCGGGDREPDSHPLRTSPIATASTSVPIAQAPRRSPLRTAAAPRRMPTADELFDWAERTYPQYFPSHRITQSLDPYVYRHYPETGNYVGLAGEAIVVLGPISGGEVLTVGKLSTFACLVLPAECNTPPVAEAGGTRSVKVGDTVQLDASNSSDPDGDLLTFNWSLVSTPGGSVAGIGTPDSVRATFIPDKAGTYVLRLTVRDAFTATSATVNITAAVANVAPVAKAGQDQNVFVGTTVTLDGSASSDANGDALRYEWILSQRPAGSAAVLSGAATARPTFTADKAGSYIATLVVHDHATSSGPASVKVTAAILNVAPIANAGTPQTVTAGTVVTLNGAASSDSNGDSLAFLWAFTSRPGGSVAVLVNASTPTPSFLADVAGTYTVALVVGDGKLVSQPATVTVTATAPPTGPLQLLLFGGSGGNTYLGCLTCNQFDSESVCNQFGTYGSQFSSSSIWNQFGTYGSQFATYSPWNQFSSSGPAIVGTDGNFYGYFTVNQFKSQRTTIGWAVQTLNFYASTGSHTQTRNFLCGG